MSAPGSGAVPGRFRALPVDVDALQIVLGVTTKSDILALCPTANVGVPETANSTDERDLRWIVVETSGDLVEVNHGDWIVAIDGGFEVLSDRRFRALFASVAGEAAR